MKIEKGIKRGKEEEKEKRSMSARKKDHRKQRRRVDAEEMMGEGEEEGALDPPTVIIGNMAKEVLALSAHMEGRGGAASYASSYMPSPLSIAKRPTFEPRTPIRYNPGSPKKKSTVIPYTPRKRVVEEEDIATSSESESESESESSSSDSDDDDDDDEAERFFKSLLIGEYESDDDDDEADRKGGGDGLENLAKLEKIVREYKKEKKGKKGKKNKNGVNKKSYDEVMEIAGLAVKEARNRIKKLERKLEKDNDTSSDYDDYF